MNKILKYWKPINDEQFTYSCDMVRIVFQSRSDSIQSLVNYFNNPTRLDIKEYPPNLSNWKYRFLFVIECGESSATIGLCFNGSSKEEMYKGFLEFNPNKCLPCETLERDISHLLLHCTSFDISRFDLAIDMPFDREMVFMEKDLRKYSMEMTSYSSRTEYLGQRNNKGRVKLYNKSAESNLDKPLTRLEVTFGDTKELLNQWNLYVPKVYKMDTQNEIILTDELSETQKVLVQLLRNSDNPTYYLKQINYRTAKKIEPYIFSQNARLNFNFNTLYEIVANLNDLFNIH